MLSPEERRALLERAWAARGEECFALADELDAAGVPPNAYDLGDGRIRFAQPVESLIAAEWQRRSRQPQEAIQTVNPLLSPPPQPLAYLDQPLEDVPDTAYRARW